jgi:hypothetical protein
LIIKFFTWAYFPGKTSKEDTVQAQEWSGFQQGGETEYDPNFSGQAMSAKVENEWILKYNQNMKSYPTCPHCNSELVEENKREIDIIQLQRKWICLECQSVFYTSDEAREEA